MFNTEIIHFLQSFDHPILHGFMWFISFLGLTPILMTISLSIAFGLDLKKGLVLLNIVAWTAFICTLLKTQIDFPRPSDVDPSIKIEAGSSYSNDLRNQQPRGFLELFSVEVLEQTRNDAIVTYGFPSGHAAIQTSLWLSFLLLFKRRWIYKWAFSIIFLAAISRIYLGYHFLGDVLGGILLGTIITLIILFIVHRSKYLRLQTHDTGSLLFFWLPWLTLPFAAYIPYWQMASVLGLNMAVLYIIQRRNFPVFHVITWKRILATLLVIVFYLSTYYFNKLVHLSSSAVLDFLIIAVLNFVAIRGALSLSRRLFLIKYRLVF